MIGDEQRRQKQRDAAVGGPEDQARADRAQRRSSVTPSEAYPRLVAELATQIYVGALGHDQDAAFPANAVKVASEIVDLAFDREPLDEALEEASRALDDRQIAEIAARAERMQRMARGAGPPYRFL